MCRCDIEPDLGGKGLIYTPIIVVIFLFQYGGYTNWDVNEPNNYDNEDCVHIRGVGIDDLQNGVWNDVPCESSSSSKSPGYICKKRSGTP